MDGRDLRASSADDLPTEQVALIEAAIEALQREEYKPRDIALAGAFVTLAHDGSVRIERGFVRAEDEPKSKAKLEQPEGKRPAKDADGLAPLSEKLVAELTAYRTFRSAQRVGAASGDGTHRPRSCAHAGDVL